MDSLRQSLPHNRVKRCDTNVEANRYVGNILQKIFISIGLNFFVPGYRMGGRIWFMIFMTHILILSFIYMLFTDELISVKLEAFILVIVIYQGLHKMYTAIFLNQYYFKIVQVIRDLHLKYVEDPVIAPALKQICYYSAVLFELLSSSYYAVATTYMILPIFMWKQYGVFTTIFPIQFPFIDWHTPIGYAINIVNHVYINIAGPTGIIAGDVVFMYFVLHSVGYTTIFKNCVANLDELLENEPQDLKKIQTQFYKCIQAHQEHIKYVELVDKGFDQLCLAQLVTSEIGLTLSLFATLWSNWIIGPFLVLAGIFQLLEYCILGTVVTVQNEKVLETIYNMKWYLLPVRYQKLVTLMLLRAQNSPELNVGSFAKLNVETAMNVLNATYSYLMMMLNFIK